MALSSCTAAGDGCGDGDDGAPPGKRRRGGGSWRRFVAWFLLDFVGARLAFAQLNRRAFEGWRCPSSSAAGRGEGGGGRGGAAGQRDGNGTGLEVIVASFGSAGSTSVHVALEAMGVRAWGTEEFGFYSPHLDWTRLADEDWTGPTSVLRSCGVRAVVADALCLPAVRALVPHSPDAKLVFLTRTWQSWVASRRNMQARGPVLNQALAAFAGLFLCHWLPYGLVWPWQQHEVGTSFMHAGSSLTMDLLGTCHMMWRFYTDFPKAATDRRLHDWRELADGMMDSEQRYLDAEEELRKVLGPDRVLDAGVGSLDFEKLSELLGRDPPVFTGPLPQAKAGGFGKSWVRISLHPLRHAALLALFAASAGANWVLFGAAWRLLAAAAPSAAAAAPAALSGGGRRPHAD